MKNGEDINQVMKMPVAFMLSILEEEAIEVADKNDKSAFNFLP